LQGQRGMGEVVFFAEVHFALKGWLGRKWSAQVLVRLQAMESGHLALGLPGLCARQTRSPQGVWAALPLRGANPSATYLALRSKKGAALKIFSCTPYVAWTCQLEHCAYEKCHQKKANRQKRWLMMKARERNIDFQKK